MTHLLENELYRDVYQTAILLLTVCVLSFVSYFFLKKGLKVVTHANKLKMRIVYVACLLFVFFFVKIWVKGFTQVIYGISLVSAGLVVTNKESIMNLVGWGIISWRGLFSEGDFIEVAGFSGVVYELGFLYFKLLEASPNCPDRSTGKLIKIPNGTIINSVTKRVALDKHCLEQQLHCLIPLACEFNAVKLAIQSMVDQALHAKRQQACSAIKDKNRMFIKNYVQQPPLVTSTFSLDKPDYVKITISYHCLMSEKLAIDALLTEKLATLLTTLHTTNSLTGKTNA